MGRNSRKNLPLIEGIEITGLGMKGKAVARKDDMVIFTENVIPGDVVDIKITKKKRKYMEGRVMQLVKPSDKRIEPFCSHSGTCGGCNWQVLPYDEQLTMKRQHVVDCLVRLGGLKDLPEVRPTLGSEKQRLYRNKVEYTFSNKRWLMADEVETEEEFTDKRGAGFFIPKRWDRILDIDTCYLQAEPSNGIRLFLKNYAKENNFSFYDPYEKVGFMRNVMIRTSTTGELMVMVIFGEDDKESRDAMLNALHAEFPEITALLYIINKKLNDSFADLPYHLHAGNDHIFEQMEALRFKIKPKSFYQTNSEQAYELYKVTRDMAQLTGQENVYDLYTGAGTIAQFVSHQAKHVVGIEYVQDAIDAANENVVFNNIENCTFYAGDMKRILNDELIAKHGKPDVIITDPPRAGMDPEVIDTIINAAPKRIVYVSCNPATQARDLDLLSGLYEIVKIQPVDMFPHTYHVENVVLLEKRQPNDK